MEKFECSSFPELYSKITEIGKEKFGLDEIPFSLSNLEHPSSDCQTVGDIYDFIDKCAKKFSGNESDEHINKLLEDLNENYPKVSYENPKIDEGELTEENRYLITNIFFNGIDLPGSKLNLYGKPGYYSNFFMDMYLGNQTEAMEYFNKLSKKEQKKALTVREGFCQFSPIFAPIIGQKMANLENEAKFTTKEKKEIKLLFNLNNENKQFDILKKLLKNGADANAYDIYGFTALHYAVMYFDDRIVTQLLRFGANPNAVSRNGRRPLSLFLCPAHPSKIKMISDLLQHNASLANKYHANILRAKVEKYSDDIHLSVRVREAHPRDKNECEKCMKTANKKCAACHLVVYCSSECQKVDWKFHKITCKKSKDQ
jgi:hypothetical protein